MPSLQRFSYQSFLTASVSAGTPDIQTDVDILDSKVQINGLKDNMNKEAKAINEDLVPQIIVEEIDKDTLFSESDEVDILGKDRPTSFYNISANGAYEGSFWTNNSVIFTNYYFSPNNDGELYLDISTEGDYPYSKYAYVYVYSTNSDKILTETELEIGKSYRLRTYNLNVNNFYYYGFGVEALGRAYSGEISVSH